MNARVKAYAKLNLTLHITGEEGGYHNLDSLVLSVDLFDLIKAEKRKRDNLINVTMYGRGSEALSPKENNAVKAAEKFVARYGCGGADITIYKNIPMQAGLGGSSADVAGVLRAMARLYPVADESGLKQLADELGSDTGFMLTGGCARLRARGTQIEELSFSGKPCFLLLLPPQGVSTAECYRLYNGGISGNSDEAARALERGDLRALGKNLYNALEVPARTINPDVGTAIDELKQFDPLGVCMTGSGSGVYAMFENIEFCEYAASRYKGKFKCFILKSHNIS